VYEDLSPAHSIITTPLALTPGSRLGVYEVIARIGVGGMGQVYRARDTKLNRDVALKILPESFASDPDRLARFTREAQTLASLNHPNIAHIHGLEESGAITALVMELVEGEDLSQRVARGSIPLDEALPIAKQIAEALEAAHEQGIIHRDLKPSNIKLRPDGTAKVLDFGLAKAIDPRLSATNVSQSPTITGPARTGIGVILGTAAYMSPEQARGKSVDKRTDIWAFGVVVFEIVTGHRLFSGETISDTLASILTTDPNWSALPTTVPPDLRRLLRKCLEKDPKRRLQAMGDARIQIDDLLGRAPEVSIGAAVSRPLRPWQRVMPWAVAGGLAVVLMFVVWAEWRNTGPPAQPMRLSAELGADARLVTDQGAAAVLSPAGTTLAFVAQENTGGRPQLYVRRLEQLHATPLSGTAGADSPFFSPDGQWIAFFADQKLKKISVTGGPTVTVCDAPNTRGGAWGDDGTIAFSPSVGGSLLRVSSAGGNPEPLTTLDDGEVTQRWPQLLPGGKAVLYSGHTSTSGFDNASIIVQPLPAGARKVVQRSGYYGRYLPSGHLVYIHDGTLFAAPFDLDKLELTSQPVPVLEGVIGNTFGGGQFAVSNNGTLVYLPGRSLSYEAPIHWMDRDGKTTPLRTTPANWNNPLFAPDGRRLAMDINDGKQLDVWVYDWERETPSRLTFDPSDEQKPVWTPDGRRIVVASNRADKSTPNIYWQLDDGTGAVQRLTNSKNRQLPASWHPSGKFLAFSEFNSQTNEDLMILPMEGDESAGWTPGKPTVFLNTPFLEFEPMFSPSGHWIAYFSRESGRFEVYVRPFPGPGGKWQISTTGGIYPTWSRTRSELFFSTTDGQIMVAPYTAAGDSFRAQKPHLWSGDHFSPPIGPNRTFDLHPDGERFALRIPEAQTDVKDDHVTLIFNFFDELRRNAPAAKR
jgi:Tol biopolymer transport system component